jgi:hypothetical protein
MHKFSNLNIFEYIAVTIDQPKHYTTLQSTQLSLNPTGSATEC